jgi:hypothetical protein
LKHPWCFLNTQFSTDVCSCFLNCSSFDCTLLDLVIYRRSWLHGS